jgi:hypothetical protein
MALEYGLNPRFPNQRTKQHNERDDPEDNNAGGGPHYELGGHA